MLICISEKEKKQSVSKGYAN